MGGGSKGRNKGGFGVSIRWLVSVSISKKTPKDSSANTTMKLATIPSYESDEEEKEEEGNAEELPEDFKNLFQL